VVSPVRFTGGSFGLFGFDAFNLSSLSRGATAAVYYCLALGLLAFVSLVIYVVIRSPVGAAFNALRDAEPYAVARGIDARRYQIIVFGFTAGLTGLAGALYADYQGTATPSILGFEWTLFLLAMIVIGGWGTLTGPVIGAVVVTIFSEVLRDVDEWRLLVLGTLMIIMIVYAPKGVVGVVTGLSASAAPLRRRITRWLDEDD
jgi:branched-chain amino acid transport system permease protein